MRDLITSMREKLFSVLNPNDQYSQEDFDKEFNQVDSTLNSFKMNLTLVNDSTNENPEFATNGSSGFDFRANLEQPILIEPFKRAIVPTGLFFNIPENFEIQVRPRSGLSAKHGVTVLNTPGTIDADYRGEIKIILINLGEENFTISHGDRIAQGVFASVLGKNILNLIEVETLETNTERGSGGFGSTGLG